MTWRAQALSECWWRRCRLPGAPVQAGFDGSPEDHEVQLCGLHAQVVAEYLVRGGWDVELWDSPAGLPVILLRKVEA